MDGESFLIVSVPFASDMLRVWLIFEERLRINFEGNLLVVADRAD